MLVATLVVILVEVVLALAFAFIQPLVFGAPISELLGLIPFYAFWVSTVTLLMLVLFGIPSFLLLNRYNSASTINLAIVGFLISAILVAIPSLWPDANSGFSFSRNYYGSYRQLIDSGIRTSWGWVSLIEEIVQFGIHGAVGAVAFKKVLNSKSTVVAA